MYVCSLENERLCLSKSLSILLMSAVCLASYKLQKDKDASKIMYITLIFVCLYWIVIISLL